MTNQTTGPILIFDYGEIVIEDDLEVAELLFGLHDIGDTDLKIYDSAGNVMVLRGGYVEIERSFLFLRWKSQEVEMHLAVKEPIQNEANRLRDVLIEFIEEMNHDDLFTELDNVALPELIDIASHYSL